MCNSIWSLLKRRRNKERKKICQLLPLIPLCLYVWESVYCPDFADSWMVWTENGTKKGWRGLNRMGVHLIVQLDKSWSLTDQRLLLLGRQRALDKILGCSVSGSGREGASSAYLIELCAITMCNRNQCLRSTRGLSIERDKRVGWLHVTVSVKIPLYHRVHISPHSAFNPKWTLQYFARTQADKLIKVLLSWDFA